MMRNDNPTPRREVHRVPNSGRGEYKYRAGGEAPSFAVGNAADVQKRVPTHHPAVGTTRRLSVFSKHPSLVTNIGGGVITAVVALVLLLIVFAIALPAHAQETTPSGTLTVTDDQVNMVAKRLYCPVCEDVPLDACGTDACIQWRADIRQQLQQGKTSDEIVADFVRRFGQRVVGTPQDPTLRSLSLVTPYLLGAFALTFGLFTLWRWRRSRATVSPPDIPDNSENADSDYRARLERDLRQRQ